MDDDIRPWERQPGETAKQFAAFVQYRDLPPNERTVRRAWEIATGRGRDETGPRRQIPGYVREWAGQHQWGARAEAWDRHLDRQAQAVLEQGRVAAVKRHLEVARTAQAMGLSALRDAQARDGGIPPAVAARLVLEGVQLERLLYGEPAQAQQVDLRVSEEGAPEAGPADREARIRELMAVLAPKPVV